MTPFAAAGEWKAQQAAGPYVLELSTNPRTVVGETSFVIRVTLPNGRPVATDKASGHAEFSSGGLKGVATLHPDGENRMKGHGSMSAKPDLRIDVTISLPGASPQRAVFVNPPASP